MYEVLGVLPGSVTAFSVINDGSRRVGVVLEADLMRHESVNCHPLENTATTNIALDDLLRFIRACGHEPRIAMLGAPWEPGAWIGGPIGDFAATGPSCSSPRELRSGIP